MKTNLHVENMQCAHCVSTINKALLKINGIYGVEANVANHSIQIEHSEEVSLTEIAYRLTELGYPESSKEEDVFAAKAEDWDLNPIRINQAKKFFERVAELVPLKAENTLMDFGCGTGLVGLQFAPYVDRLVMVDNSLSMLSVLQKKISFFQLDDSKIKIVSTGIINIPSGNIDILVSLMTLHHLEKIEPVINEFYQKLTVGGHIALADLITEDGSFHDETVPHNGFDPQEIETYLRNAGFNLVLSETYNSITKPTVNGMKEFKQFLIIAKK